MEETLRPRERIKKRKDFLILYKKGYRYRGRYFTLIFLPSNREYSRVGVVASRKVGEAVTRNKVKRWMRELFRRNKGLFESPADLLIVATPEAKKATLAELNEDYQAALKRIYQRRGRV